MFSVKNVHKKTLHKVHFRLYLIIYDALVQKLIFQDGVSGHLGFDPLAKNPGTFGGNLEDNFYKWSKEVKPIIRTS